MGENNDHQRGQLNGFIMGSDFYFYVIYLTIISVKKYKYNFPANDGANFGQTQQLHSVQNDLTAWGK